jgi:hypothetical protein
MENAGGTGNFSARSVGQYVRRRPNGRRRMRIFDGKSAILGHEALTWFLIVVRLRP